MAEQDQLEPRPDLAIMVSAGLPEGTTRVGMRDGRLVTDQVTALALASVVRVGLQQASQKHVSAGSRDEKRARLCRYLRSGEFLQRVDAIVAAFTAMRSELERDRRSAGRRWARRAQRIDAATFIISGMNGRLQDG